MTDEVERLEVDVKDLTLDVCSMNVTVGEISWQELIDRMRTAHRASVRKTSASCTIPLHSDECDVWVSWAQWNMSDAYAVRLDVRGRVRRPLDDDPIPELTMRKLMLTIVKSFMTWAHEPASQMTALNYVAIAPPVRSRRGEQCVVSVTATCTTLIGVASLFRRLDAWRRLSGD